jgi:hypothetical protein
MKKIQAVLKRNAINIPDSIIKGICSKFKIGVFTNNHREFIIEYVIKNY